MKPRLAIPVFVLGVTSAMLLSACGSSNRASTIATMPPASSPSQPAATTPTTTATQAPPVTNPRATRTATAPAFVQTQPKPTTQVGAAVAAVNRAGYRVADTSTYKTNQTLTVLIGSRGSGQARVQQAFFFINGRYIGTDTRSPSASLLVVSQNDTAVTLRYALYKPGDQTPSGSSNVQFVLNNGRLAPLDTIPPISSASGGRR